MNIEEKQKKEILKQLDIIIKLLEYEYNNPKPKKKTKGRTEINSILKDMVKWRRLIAIQETKELAKGDNL